MSVGPERRTVFRDGVHLAFDLFEPAPERSDRVGHDRFRPLVGFGGRHRRGGQLILRAFDP